jgi:hypothetical protein
MQIKGRYWHDDQVGGGGGSSPARAIMVATLSKCFVALRTPEKE